MGFAAGRINWQVFFPSLGGCLIVSCIRVVPAPTAGNFPCRLAMYFISGVPTKQGTVCRLSVAFVGGIRKIGAC
jgi:hypothetical protein